MLKYNYKEESHLLIPTFKMILGLSTLRQWAGKFIMDRGVLKDVLMLIKNIGKSLMKMYKVTVISFDETYVAQKLCYDKKIEQVLGPFNCAQVMIARGV
jgi:hypothetical protein